MLCDRMPLSTAYSNNWPASTLNKYSSRAPRTCYWQPRVFRSAQLIIQNIVDAVAETHGLKGAKFSDDERLACIT